ncbi:uncharacterized protein KY384_004636 [Bacidia gigantensis]|uniref:uncharacterized protein n=1 Tax=Bacidia gigantensis TaxID=2732470 RepID=UPI001D04EB2C|nr:uncharacterized protein KY384_004636 [Bacidia gigantensis]KAG8530598.1 hypothetical protein KY384_004636 [Bacidia gigantensis]
MAVGFLDLALETRQQLYNYALLPNDEEQRRVLYKSGPLLSEDPNDNTVWTVKAICKPDIKQYLGLLQTCRQVNEEATRTFYTNSVALMANKIKNITPENDQPSCCFDFMPKLNIGASFNSQLLRAISILRDHKAKLSELTLECPITALSSEVTKTLGELYTTGSVVKVKAYVHQEPKISFESAPMKGGGRGMNKRQHPLKEFEGAPDVAHLTSHGHVWEAESKDTMECYIDFDGKFWLIRLRLDGERKW